SNYAISRVDQVTVKHNSILDDTYSDIPIRNEAAESLILDGNIAYGLNGGQKPLRYVDDYSLYPSITNVKERNFKQSKTIEFQYESLGSYSDAYVFGLLQKYPIEFTNCILSKVTIISNKPLTTSNLNLYIKKNGSTIHSVDFMNQTKRDSIYSDDNGS